MKKLVLIIILFATYALISYSQDSPKTDQTKKQPKATYQIGSAKITVWENQGKYGAWKNFKVEKVYQKDGKWMSTNSFNDKELLELKSVIDTAISNENVIVKTKK